jgi:hypothetical protein
MFTTSPQMLRMKVLQMQAMRASASQTLSLSMNSSMLIAALEQAGAQALTEENEEDDDA